MGPAGSLGDEIHAGSNKSISISQVLRAFGAKWATQISMLHWFHEHVQEQVLLWLQRCQGGDLHTRAPAPLLSALKRKPTQ